MDKNWVVLIAGGHAAGKKTVCKDIQTNLEQLAKQTDLNIQVRIVHMSDYAKSNNDSSATNGPQDCDFGRLRFDLDVPSKNSSLQSSVASLAAPGSPTVTIVEGLYALYDSGIRDLAVMKVFVDSDADTRLSRWILRDVGPNTDKLGDILNNYLTRARPEFLESIAPTKEFADIVLPRGSEQSGIALISTGIYDLVHHDMDGRGMGTGNGSPYLRTDTPTLGLTRMPKLNLRRESFNGQSQRFHDLS